MANRLSNVAIDLAHQMEGLSASVLRRVAAEAAARAVTRTQLRDLTRRERETVRSYGEAEPCGDGTVAGAVSAQGQAV